MLPEVHLHINLDNMGKRQSSVRSWVQQLYIAVVKPVVAADRVASELPALQPFVIYEPSNFRNTASRQRVERGAQRSIGSGEAEFQMRCGTVALIGSGAECFSAFGSF